MRSLTMSVLKNLGLGLLLSCILLGNASAVAPDPSERPLPEDPNLMQLSAWAWSNRANQSAATNVQQTHPAFKWTYPGDADLEPIPDGNRLITLEARDVGGETITSPPWASLHDIDTGRAHSVCLMPCTVTLNAQKDYLIAVRDAGRMPVFNIIQAGSSDSFTISMTPDFRNYFKKISQCWADHVASGKPDMDATPCARTPAMIPAGAERSGHCRVQFDVLETGWVANGRSLGCTDPVFASAALDVLNLWYYVPATQSGQALPTTGLVTKINFDILDSQGRRIDENGRVEQ